MSVLMLRNVSFSRALLAGLCTFLRAQSHCTYVAFVSLSDANIFLKISMCIHICYALYIESECAPGVCPAVCVSEKEESKPSLAKAVADLASRKILNADTSDLK